MNKKLLTALAGSSLLLLAACSNDTVATTKVGNVSKEELYQAMRIANGSQALYTLLVEKVATANIKDKTALDNEVTEYIATRVQSSGGTEAFLKLIQSYGYETETAFRSAVYANRAILTYIKEQTTVSDEDVAKAYETWEPSVTASHILVSDEETAKSIITRLKNGEDWSALAKEFSVDESNKNNGGQLGSFKASSMVKEFSDALPAMKDGDISETPVKTNFGFHIIKMEKNAVKGSLEEVKETVRTEAIDAKVNDTQYQQEVVTKMLQEADINIKDNFLKTALDVLLNPVSAPALQESAPASSTQQSSSQESSAQESSSK